MKLFGSHIPSKMQNLAINGNFDFWQEKGNTTTTVNTATAQNAYAADMWAYASGGSSTHNYSIAQLASAAPTEAQSGFQSSLVYNFTRITGLVSPSASDYTIPSMIRVEGYDYAKLHGKTVTFGFWVQASVAGTYSFVVQNGAQTRAYATTFVVNGSNTWEFKSIAVAMEVPTTNYTFVNGLGIQVLIGAVTGTTFSTSSLNSWQSGQIFAAAAATNWMATSGATFRLSQFSIVEGPLGFSATGFQRAGDDIQAELAMCQRYYEQSYRDGLIPRTNVGNNSGEIQTRWPSAPSSSDEIYSSLNFRVHKRALPSIELWSPTGVQNQFNRDGGGTLAAQVWNAGSNYYAAVATNGAASNTAVHRIHIIADARL